ncbi:hypothetical protein MiAbW_03628 [Microcystis aeruginosa NIES-4325]|uniref:Uncharacterized protein n=1 Tax=Microcystis aeruginosa NIES-4325 TaxID=2569534 RepID=A0A5J4FCK3_MICAE|nr:hypothetical protein [Microcystis aeruginosa]GEA29046.1 hypothetical protein MiAbW_03628 [Microcystis aeruginosa NIES-4325]
MSKFYFVRDSIGQCWVNLDHVTFINLESDKLILKMSNNSSVFVDGDDVVALSQVLWNHTVNWEDEFRDDKRYNHEDIPSLEEVMQNEPNYEPTLEEIHEDYPDLKLDDDDDDDFPYPTGIRLEESEF